jgi:hypothetical protein
MLSLLPSSFFIPFCSRTDVTHISHISRPKDSQPAFAFLRHNAPAAIFNCYSFLHINIALVYSGFDRLCGLVVRVLDYRSRGSSSIPDATRCVWNGVHSASWIQLRSYGRWDPSHWPRDKPYPQQLALTSPTSGGRSVGIFRSRTKATQFSLYLDIIVVMSCKKSMNPLTNRNPVYNHSNT